MYAAEHVTLGHEVAVKVLRGAAARDGGEIARLRREAYIQVHVEHPNVVRVLDLDQMPDGSIYVIMERLIGRSLADKLSRDGLLAPGHAIAIFSHVCRALDAAHRKDVVHRDLKPGNIFLCEDGIAKVLDFGMSKLATRRVADAGRLHAWHPRVHGAGAMHRSAGRAADGHLCAGGHDVRGADRRAARSWPRADASSSICISGRSRRPMRQRRPDLPIPEALDQAVMKCLKKRVNERPKGAAQLEQMLSAVPMEGLAMSYPPGISRRAPAQAGTLSREEARRAQRD